MNALDFHQPPPRVRTLAEAQALSDQLWGLGRVVQEQQGRIEQLEEQVRLSSGDSSKPPSSDDAKARAARRKQPRSGRQRGAQPGHAGQARVMVEAVDHTERYYPDGHCSCGGAIEPDAQPTLRHPVFDLPEVRYTVTEYQQYAGRCCRCGQRHLAELPDWVSRGQMGPGLISAIGLLNGQYRMSLRQVQTHLRCRWGLDFSLGAISESQGKLAGWLAPLYVQLGAAVRRAPVAHADETTHYHCGWRLWLWTLCSGPLVYLMSHYGRGKSAAAQRLADFAGVLITDRLGSYNGYPSDRRQLCWAHVIRNLERIAARPDPGGGIGQRLVRLARGVIRVVHHHRRGMLSERTYRRRIQRLRAAFQDQLHAGTRCARQPRTVSQCEALLRDEPMLWTFLDHPGLPLTNNTAERALRPYVIWRKTSFASQSRRGLAFRERILSVLGTAHNLGLNSHQLLRRVCTEGLQGRPITPLPIDQPLLPKSS